MAVAVFDPTEFYRLLSSDTKPTKPAHDLAYETDTGNWFIYNGSGWVNYTGPNGLSPAQSRSAFVGELLTILGDTRLLWMAQSGDTTTSTGKSLNAGTITWDATVATRLSAQGLGYAQTFASASSQYGSIPDSDIYSFGTSTADSAFSLIALANVTDTAANRDLICKAAGSNREYTWRIGTTDKLTLTLIDESAGVGAVRTATASASMGSWALFGATYSAATGGASAANDMVLYQNGVSVASSATNNASYVAMENLGSAVELGSDTAHTAGFLDGSYALAAIVAKAMTASEMWAVKTLVNYYYALSL